MKKIEDHIALDTIVSRIDGLPTVDLEGEIGMMHIEKGKYYGLDSVGSRIWELMNTPKTIDTIIQTLLEEYKVDVETCKDHVLEFVHVLNNAELLKVNNM